MRIASPVSAFHSTPIDGRGDLLMVHQDFSQPVKMTSERTFELTNDVSKQDVIYDITSNIAWDVLSKKGSVYFTSQDEIKDLGENCT